MNRLLFRDGFYWIKIYYIFELYPTTYVLIRRERDVHWWLSFAIGLRFSDHNTQRQHARHRRRVRSGRNRLGSSGQLLRYYYNILCIILYYYNNNNNNDGDDDDGDNIIICGPLPSLSAGRRTGLTPPPETRETAAAVYV